MKLASILDKLADLDRRKVILLSAILTSLMVLFEIFILYCQLNINIEPSKPVYSYVLKYLFHW